MAACITPAQMDIVKATAPVLKEHGNTITTCFYNNMLDAHPELKNIFNITSQSNGRQPRALAASVLAYAQHVDNLAVLAHGVERIAQKHASLFVSAEQYDIVGRYLLGAIGQVLGPAATPEIVDAWTAAYGALAQLFIQREAQLHAENAPAWGPKGWRKFKIAKKIPESSNIVSLSLAPSDRGKLPPYLPGQYVSLQLMIPSLGHLQSRQYSMSIAPREQGDYYRVSVKREEAGADNSPPPGLLSNMLHDELKEGDEVELSHPQGEFFVDPGDTSKDGVPLVLICAGVGATPMMSILEAVAGGGSGTRTVSWIQAAVSESRIPFLDQVKAVVEANKHGEGVKASIFLKDGGEGIPTSGSAGGGISYRGFAKGYKGRIALNRLDEEQDLFLGNDRTEYCVCGPEGWMVAVRKGLMSMGVGKDRIALELFNTGEVPDE